MFSDFTLSLFKASPPPPPLFPPVSEPFSPIKKLSLLEGSTSPTSVLGGTSRELGYSAESLPCSDNSISEDELKGCCFVGVFFKKKKIIFFLTCSALAQRSSFAVPAT